jgi:hypothetical protein
MGIFSTIKDKIFGTTTTEPKEGTTAAASTGTAATTATTAPVDVEAVMEAIVKAKGQPSNWRVSIVDLMKALDMDSSLSARKELAKELKYTGTDPDGSAEKNIWLHKALMKALAENGGKVPKELLK